MGFRSKIISTAQIYGIRGYPPINDMDGSVKMICEGTREQLDEFLKHIDIREETPTGIKVEVMEKKEIPGDFPLPVRFAPTETEELRDISRKLDEGVESLKNIEGSLERNTELLSRNTELLSRNTELLSRNTESLRGIEGSLERNTELLSRNTELLSRNTESLRGIEGSLERNTESLRNIEGLFSRNTEILKEMNDSLPERIARALKDILK